MNAKQYHEAWLDGWESCTRFFEQAVLNGDPGFQKWLDEIEAEARELREQEILDEAAEEAARRTAAGEPLI